MKSKSVLGALICLFLVGKSFGQNSKEFLAKVVRQLDQIKSASYTSRTEAWDPGDTIPKSTNFSYVKAVVYPLDSAIGASWVKLNFLDSTHLEFAYNGHARTLIYDNSKTIYLDSFNVRKLPFRPVSVPFYFYAKSILNYILNTEDSIEIEQNDYPEVVHLKLIIKEDTQVEFFGTAHHLPKPPYTMADPTSRYEIWIDKSSLLPIKVRREMSHSISVEAVSSIKFNTLNINAFNPSDYYQQDYEIKSYREMRRQAGRANSLRTITNKKAPIWELEEPNGQSLRLENIESKQVLIQFTSVNCGPCRASIPFLNKLHSEHSRAELEVVAVECTSGNATVLEKYKTRTNLLYKLLLAKKEDTIAKDYQIEAFPTFFLLDEERVIRQVFIGYGATTKEKIIKAIGK